MSLRLHRFRRLLPALRSIAPILCVGLAALPVGIGSASAQVAILTHHNNVARTGWNRNETILTPATVGTPGAAGTFGLLATVPLNAPIDAQPLVVPNVDVEGDPNAGTHDVVYLATQTNDVLAVDPIRGTILKSVNLGPNVTAERGCNQLDIGVGIAGTPVIDTARHALYVVAYTNDELPNGGHRRTYRLHALDLSTLADQMPPMVISAEGRLVDGSLLEFVPTRHRQRTALLEYDNKIYLTFSSFCDNDQARGWILAYHANTLKPVVPGPDPIPRGGLTNRQTYEPTGRFLSTIWMSGAGPAADEQGIYYVTGNSDAKGTRFNPRHNTEHSVVRLSLDTRRVLDVFAPSNLPYLDQLDLDFGSGGVTLVPSTAPGQPPMAAAAGKFGTMYLLDRTNLGGYMPGGPDSVLDAQPIGRCWCQPAYFDDGTPTIVSSGGSQVMLWQVQSAPTKLVQRAITPPLNTGTTGFFTSVSSHGPFDTIVWAVTHPVTKNGPGISLYAFGVGKPGTELTQLFVGQAGTWTEQRHLPNIIPVVANGRVYVVSSSGLEVFGLAPAPAQ